MKARYTTSNGRLQFEVEGSTKKELFKQVAELAEVFEESECGKCHSKDIRLAVRHVDGNDFFEYHCMNPKCGCRLMIGQNKVGGGMFPVRKLDSNGKPDRKNGKPGDHKGWTMYRGKTDDD